MNWQGAGEAVKCSPVGWVDGVGPGPGYRETGVGQEAASWNSWVAVTTSESQDGTRGPENKQEADDAST